MKKLLKEVAGAFRAAIREPAGALTERQDMLVFRTWLGVAALGVLASWPVLAEMAAKTTVTGWLSFGLVASVAVIGALAYVIRDLDRYVRELRSQIGSGGGSITQGSVG